MKKVIFSFFAIFVLTISYGQTNNSIAKLKYEDAEEAFNANNYELTIKKLEEVEDLLQTTNPKIVYLKVLAQAEIVEKSLSDFSQLQKARDFTLTYMSKYGELEGNEDKFRHVYKISEKLKEYPKTDEEFRKQLMASAFMQFQYVDDMQLGWTVEQVKSVEKYKNYKIVNDMLVSKKKKGNLAFKIKDNKVISYIFYDDNVYSFGERLLVSFKERFKFEPVVDTSSYGEKTYSWIKNKKTVELALIDAYGVKAFSITVTDENIN